MRHQHVLILFTLLILSATVSAQTKQTTAPVKAKNSTPAAAKTAAEIEDERLTAERRNQAQSLLISLAADVSSYADQKLRARTLARIADALWESEEDRARNLFRRAWEAAEVADAEGEQRTQEEIRQQQAKSPGGGYVVGSQPKIREEVLRLVVRHDSALGDELLTKPKEQQGQASSPIRSGVLDGAAAQRLSVARELLAAGQTEKALQFAAPNLGIVSMQTLDFLSSLREKNPAAADQRYAAMLAIAAAAPQSEPNTALLLSSYLFTPHQYFTYGSSGGSGSSNMGGNTAPPTNIPPALRAAFFRTAGEILMRPLPQPTPDKPPTGVVGKYNVIRKLLPFFEQFGTPEQAAGLRGQMDAMSSMAAGNQNLIQDGAVRTGLSPDKAQDKTDREQQLLEMVDRARTSDERDQIYFQLAISRLRTDDGKAREYAEKIEDSELRQQVRAYVDVSQAKSAVSKKDVERAMDIARNGELTHLQRVWIIAGVARFLNKTDRARALDLLDEAANEARRIDRSEEDRPRAFLLISNAMFAIDQPRGWDSMNDVVKAANSSPTFTGEDGQLTLRVIAKRSRSMSQQDEPDMDLAGIFRLLTNENYDRAVEIARAFENAAPRANAVIAIALTVLQD